MRLMDRDDRHQSTGNTCGSRIRSSGYSAESQWEVSCGVSSMELNEDREGDWCRVNVDIEWFCQLHGNKKNCQDRDIINENLNNHYIFRN